MRLWDKQFLGEGEWRGAVASDLARPLPLNDPRRIDVSYRPFGMDDQPDVEQFDNRGTP